MRTPLSDGVGQRGGAFSNGWNLEMVWFLNGLRVSRHKVEEGSCAIVRNGVPGLRWLDSSRLKEALLCAMRIGRRILELGGKKGWDWLRKCHVFVKFLLHHHFSQLTKATKLKPKI